jgi:hypothetical protein
MRSFRTLGTALTVAMVMAATMMVSSAPAFAAPLGGNSKVALCRNLERAIAALTAVHGAESELVLAVQAQYEALGCAAPAPAAE